MATIDETDIIDREAEAASFAKMLECTSPKRVLIVSDRSGSGKSALLRKLRFLCENRHEVPVALADLKDYENKPDEWFVVSDMGNDLRGTGAELPNFTALDGARSLQRTDVFAQRLESMRGAVDLSGATVSGGQVAGIILNNPGDVNLAPQPWTDEAERYARVVCIEAFLADVLVLARQQPVVLLFDTLDKASERLRRWLFQRLVRQTVVTGWDSHKLFVVLAGPNLLPVLQGRLKDEHLQCVASAALGDWDLEQVAAFLKVHKYTLPEPMVEAIYELIQRTRTTLQQALNVAEVLMEGEPPR